MKTMILESEKNIPPITLEQLVDDAWNEVLKYLDEIDKKKLSCFS